MTERDWDCIAVAVGGMDMGYLPGIHWRVKVPMSRVRLVKVLSEHLRVILSYFEPLK
jgi:hypothetical protein